MAEENNELKNIFNETLNSHGYAFQYAVIQAAKEACNYCSSCWIFEASEFPVEANGKNTRIDFVLQSKGKDYYLAAECKRVNPAFNKWCFVKAPIVCRNHTVDKFNIEFLNKRHALVPKVLTKGEIMPNDISYHIGIAVKDNKVTGNSSGKSDRDAIEQASSQVCLGLNGLIRLLANVKDSNVSCNGFIPVIFTTASLWASDCDLSQTNLENGNIDLSETSLQEKPWLLYQYHLTPGIKHPVESQESSNELSKILCSDYIRTIPIVNANYVKEFLTWLVPNNLFS